MVEAGGELCIVVKWLDAPAAGTTNKRKIVGETQSLTLEQWKGDYNLQGSQGLVVKVVTLAVLTQVES